MAEFKSRRPLATRQMQWAQGLSNFIARSSISPNQISALSVFFAVGAGGCYAGIAWVDAFADAVLLLLGALFVQMRLLCNLLDGMVAIESGKASSTGAFWNEVPDRYADVFIFIGVGIGCGVAWLGWAAACLAVFIAYLRAFGSSVGQPDDFRGPMAKPHRMAALTAASVLAAIFMFWIEVADVLRWALWAIILGEVVTIYRRTALIRHRLKNTN